MRDQKTKNDTINRTISAKPGPRRCDDNAADDVIHARKGGALMETSSDELKLKLKVCRSARTNRKKKEETYHR
jgi:hypothetical protein